MGGPAARHSSHGDDHEGPALLACLSLLQGHALNRRSRIFTYYRRKFNQSIILFIFKHLLTYFLLLLILNFASCFRYVCAMEGEQPSCPNRSLNSPIFSEHHYLLCFYYPRPPPPKGKILSSGILTQHPNFTAISSVNRLSPPSNPYFYPARLLVSTKPVTCGWMSCILT